MPSFFSKIGFVAAALGGALTSASSAAAKLPRDPAKARETYPGVDVL